MGLSHRAHALVGGTIAAGMAALVVACLRAASMPLSTLALLGAAVAVTELFQVSADESSPDSAGGSSFSFSSGVHIASVIMLGPWAGAIVGAFGVLAVDPVRGLPWRRTLFNASVFVLSTLGGGYVFVAAGGHPGSADFPTVLPALGALALTYTALNTVLVGLAVATTSSMRLWPFVCESARTELSSKAAEAGWGAAFARFGLYDPSAIVVLVPLVLAIYQAHARLAQLRRETARALETFANIVDERDRYTYRHSARVSDYVAALAARLGLADSDVERLRWAGRLHDLGKISVDSATLQRPGRLTKDEWTALQRHPRLSARLLRRFHFASHEAQAVEYHHERFDGNGYYGIDGADLPIASHFLIVADSYDAMTTDRPYRRALTEEEALTEIESNLGRQFHPAVGAAFVAHQRGLDPRACLTPEQLSEIRTLSPRGGRAFQFGRLLADRVELPPVAAIVIGLAAAAFHWYVVAGGAFACGGAMLARHFAGVIRARKLRTSLRRLLAGDAARRRQFDRFVGEFGRRADIRWAGLVDWQESEMNGTVALERGVTSGPSDLALTSWLTREAEAGVPLLVAGGAEVGSDGYHIAVPLRSAAGVAGFFVLVFARRPARYFEDVLASLSTDLTAAFERREVPVAATVPAVEAVAS